MSKRNVFVLEPLQIAHHLGFAVIAIEIRVLQIFAASHEVIWDNRSLFPANDLSVYILCRK